MARKEILGKKYNKVKFADNCQLSDCRSYGISAEIQPWTAMSSVEYWGDDAVSPKGLPDGDTGCHDSLFIPLEELKVVDIFGNPLTSEQLCAGDFFPDHFDFIDESCKAEMEDEEIGVFLDDDCFEDFSYEERRDEKVIDHSILVNGKCLTHRIAEDQWYELIFKDANGDGRENFFGEDESLPKREVTSPYFSCHKEGTSTPRCFFVKPRVPKPDIHKDHRVKISRRQAETLSEFIGDNFCHETMFGPRVAVTFVSQRERRYKKPLVNPIVVAVCATKESEAEKTVKKPDNKGYFNRRVAMARR